MWAEQGLHSDAAGWFRQAAILGDGLHWTGHPHLEHFFLVGADVLREFTDRRYHPVLVVVLARLHNLLPLDIFELHLVDRGHCLCDFRSPVVRVNQVAVSVAFW